MPTPKPTVPLGLATPSPTIVPEPPTASLGESPVGVTAMAWLDDYTALIAGADASTAMLWRTTDRGASWTTISVGPGTIEDIAILGEDGWMSLLCAVDAPLPCESEVLQSADAGRTWTSVSAAAVARLSFETASRGWGVTAGPSNGDPKPLLRTADGGRTWSAVSAPCGVTGEPAAVAFVGPGHGWLACDTDLGAGSAVKGVFETTDSGGHWAVRSSVVLPGSGPDIGAISSSGYLRGIRMTAGGRGLAWFGRAGAARTLDAGATWVATSDAAADVIVPFAGWTLDDTQWFLLVNDANAGNATFLEETEDAGVTWSRILQFP